MVVGYNKFLRTLLSNYRQCFVFGRFMFSNLDAMVNNSYFILFFFSSFSTYVKQIIGEMPKQPMSSSCLSMLSSLYVLKSPLNRS